jgi:hypothetical protein
MKKKHTPYSCYEDVLRDYYGGHHRPKKKKQRSLTKSFDNGEVLTVKDNVPFEEYVVAASADSNGEIFEEYVVQASVVNDENRFEEYVLQSSTEEENTYVPVYTPPASSPVSENQDLLTNVLDPFSMGKGIPDQAPSPSTDPYTPVAGYADESPDTASLLEDIRQMRGDDATGSPAQNSGSLSSKEEEIVNDLQAILSGKKVYDPAAKKTVNREDVGKQQSVDEPATPKANDPGFKNEHAIFDRIAQNMKFANAYNLGTIQVDSQELNNRFNDFDKMMEAPAPPPSTKKNVPPPAAKKSEELDPSEFLNDLDDIHRYRSQQSPATDTPEQPASLQMSPPDSNGPNWPPRPASIRPLTTSERAAEFGTFTYEADPSTFGGDGIRVTNNWAADNIIRINIPQLNGKKAGKQVIQNGVINFHKAGEERLKALWAAWEAAGLLDRILTFEGGYAARYIRGTQNRSPRPLSNHAWGTAFDINAATNGFGQEPALMGKTGCVRELVAIANQQGFFWGGHFKGKKDGMHFELGKTL